MSIKKEIKKILISRTDAIGDVILTLPMASVLKSNYPNAAIYFLGKNYTKEIVRRSKSIDEFIDYSSLENISESELVDNLKNYEIDLVIHVFPNKKIARACKKAKIKFRLGTSRRIYHLLNCNIFSSLSRNKSGLHEAQLNLLLLDKVVDNAKFKIEEIQDLYNFDLVFDDNSKINNFLSSSKKNIILHPRSHGSAREWGVENFKKLVELLDSHGGFNIIITGTEKEAQSMSDFLKSVSDKVVNTTGKLSLSELIHLIAKSDILVAASTGPLHIASSYGIKAIGLYIMTKPMHPGRWMPIGKNASYIVYNKLDESLNSIEKIEPIKVFDKIIEND